VRHHLLDFGSLFGSASNGPTSARSGFEPLFSWRSAALEFFTLGAWLPDWSRAHYPSFPAVGRFGSDFFDPVTWTPEYPNPAFENRLPEDTFWAAEQVMAFTDEDVRALVGTGRYSDPAAADYMVRTLITRRNAIGRAYLSRPLSLANIRIDGGRVAFDELAVRHGYIPEAPSYAYKWSAFDNATEQRSAIVDAEGPAIPRSEALYLVVDITAGNESRRVAIYLKRAPSGHRIVGIERVL
jgi:hypothetical protein